MSTDPVIIRAVFLPGGEAVGPLGGGWFGPWHGRPRRRRGAFVAPHLPIVGARVECECSDGTRQAAVVEEARPEPNSDGAWWAYLIESDGPPDAGEMLK